MNVRVIEITVGSAAIIAVSWYMHIMLPHPYNQMVWLLLVVPVARLSYMYGLRGGVYAGALSALSVILSVISDPDRIVRRFTRLDEAIVFTVVFAAFALTAGILSERLRSEHQQTLSLNDELRELSVRDGLTRLYNHTFFQESLHQIIGRAERAGSHFTLLVLDLNNFKQINDTLGHQAGDRCLQDVADVLANESREGDIVCRYGGDEYAIIVDTPDDNVALEVSKRIKNAVRRIRCDGGLSPEVAIGSAYFPRDGVSAQELLHHADTAMYEDKSRTKSATTGGGAPVGSPRLYYSWARS